MWPIMVMRKKMRMLVMRRMSKEGDTDDEDDKDDNDEKNVGEDGDEENDSDGNLESVGFLTEIVRLARRWEFR